MTTVIGLDPSSKKIAVSVSTDGGKPILMVEVLSEDLARACYQAYHFVRLLVKDIRSQGERVHIFIEEPVVGRGGVYSTLRQARTQGAMVAGAMSSRATVHFANNSTWKKAVVGKGNAGKPEIKAWLRDNWPIMYVECNGDQDLMDSLCILRYGEQIIVRMKKIEQLENLADVDTKPAPRKRSRA